MRFIVAEKSVSVAIDQKGSVARSSVGLFAEILIFADYIYTHMGFYFSMGVIW